MSSNSNSSSILNDFIDSCKSLRFAISDEFRKIKLLSEGNPGKIFDLYLLLENASCRLKNYLSLVLALQYYQESILDKIDSISLVELLCEIEELAIPFLDDISENIIEVGYQIATLLDSIIQFFEKKYEEFYTISLSHDVAKCVTSSTLRKSFKDECKKYLKEDANEDLREYLTHVNSLSDYDTSDFICNRGKIGRRNLHQSKKKSISKKKSFNKKYEPRILITNIVVDNSLVPTLSKRELQNDRANQRKKYNKFQNTDDVKNCELVPQSEKVWNYNILKSAHLCSKSRKLKIFFERDLKQFSKI